MRWKLSRLSASAVVLSIGVAAMGAALAGAPAMTRSAAAEGPPTARADNFMLADAQALEGHELYRLADAKAVVLVSTNLACRSASAVRRDLQASRDWFAGQGIELMLLDSDPRDGRDRLAAAAKADKLEIPILMDTDQLIAEGLGLTYATEAVVIDPKSWAVTRRERLQDAADLKAMLSGSAATAARRAAAGCPVPFPTRPQRPISYAREVAPILEAKCVACHQQGGIGPFAMTDYAAVKGFSPMIREVIRTRRMPPYAADSHVGRFADDRRLSAPEMKTLIHWIEQGAPRGAGADPLAAVRHVAPEWPLGKPDLVLNVPAYNIPASGVVDYQRPFIVNPLTVGKWVKASTFKVEQRQGVHHFLTGYLPEVPIDGRSYESDWGSSLGSYAVGAESEVSPPNVGAYLPAGGAIGIQAHYTPYGRAVTDHSQIGLYFYKEGEKPRLVMHNSVIIDNSIAIPPNDPHHVEVAYLEFPHDAVLYAAFPHAHYRGASSDLWIHYPDGRRKLLLALPRYDFNWQRDYTFAEPIKVPAGSKLVAHYVYDNSRRNPANPDPSKTVYWGPQSWDEMLFTRIRYRWADETSDRPNDYDRELNEGRLIGMLDDNLDGVVERSELKGRVAARFGPMFDTLDRNHDGVLDKAELAAARKLAGPRD